MTLGPFWLHSPPTLPCVEYIWLYATRAGAPFTPPVSVPPAQLNRLRLSTSVMPLPAAPGVVAVTVTTAPPTVAETPGPAPLRLIAAARLVAAVAAVPSIAKNNPVFVPGTPPVSVLPDSVRPAVKFCASVTPLAPLSTTVLVGLVAVAPVAGLLLTAVWMLLASVLTAEFSAKLVPEVVPLAPGVVFDGVIRPAPVSVTASANGVPPAQLAVTVTNALPAVYVAVPLGLTTVPVPKQLAVLQLPGTPVSAAYRFCAVAALLPPRWIWLAVPSTPVPAATNV